MTNNSHDEHRKGLIGNHEGSFWLYDSETGFDLTHPSTPTDPIVSTAIKLTTTTTPITIDPAKTALVVIDMQNFFLSPALGRPKDSLGLAAQVQLLKYAIPASRKAGIQVAWLNWGLTDEDLKAIPPAVHRAFGFGTVPAGIFDSSGGTMPSKTEVFGQDLGKDAHIYKGLGQELGEITLPDGTNSYAGRMLCRDQWNTRLTPELEQVYQANENAVLPDVWLHKHRMSGLHLPTTMANQFFTNHGITTLLFAGVNTDQCVMGTIADAYASGYDCIMLTDGCATTSGQAARDCVEFNMRSTMGFSTDCRTFADDVEAGLGKRQSEKIGILHNQFLAMHVLDKIKAKVQPSASSANAANSPVVSQTSRPYPEPAVAKNKTKKRGLGWPWDQSEAHLSFYIGENIPISWLFNWELWIPPGLPVDQSIEWVPCIRTAAQITDLEPFLTDIVHNKGIPVKHLLGFNEPEIPSQAHIDPAEAARLWKEYVLPVQQKFKLRLGSPGVSSDMSRSIPWLDKFQEQFKHDVDGAHIDFLVVHWYGERFEDFANFLGEMYERFRLPIWVNEFACSRMSERKQIDEAAVREFMSTAIPFLDGLDWIERYAYYGNGQGRNVGAWVGEANNFAAKSRTDDPETESYELTNIGKLYLQL